MAEDIKEYAARKGVDMVAFLLAGAAIVAFFLAANGGTFLATWTAIMP